MLWESSEFHFGRPKKKVDKIFDNFLKIRPLEKIVDPPLDLPLCDLTPRKAHTLHFLVKHD